MAAIISSDFAVIIPTMTKSSTPMGDLQSDESEGSLDIELHHALRAFGSPRV